MLLPECYDLEQLLSRIDQPNQSKCRQLLSDHAEVIMPAPGSGHNHHAWKGGYIDHVVETMNLAIVLFDALNDARPLDFSLSEALLIMFLHDLEKPWKYNPGSSGLKVDVSKEGRKLFREKMIRLYSFELTDRQHNAMRYVEGEFQDYRDDYRAQGPLAALCHACDNLSARLWHDYPLRVDDPWIGAKRSQQ